MPLRVLR